MTLGSTTKRLSADFSLPGQPGYVADAKITAIYHNGGDATPIVLTATAPAAGPTDAADRRRHLPAQPPGRCTPGRGWPTRPTPATPHFATQDGRTSYGLVFTPPETGFGKDSTPQLTRAAAAAAPRRLDHRRDRPGPARDRRVDARARAP